MIVSRKAIAIMAAISLFPVAELVTAASAASPEKVAQLKKYQTSGSLNPVEARRVVAGFGVRREVSVKLTSGETLKGRVGQIGDDHFVMLLGRTETPTPIAYSQVQQMGSGSSKGKKVLIGVAFAAGLVAATMIGLHKAHRWPTGTVVPAGV